MNNQQVIEKFYTAFSKGDIDNMIDCYHDNIVFEDPAFGVLKGEKAKNMWRMLLSRGGENLKITYSNINANDQKGSAQWIAVYPYGPKKRKVENHVSASFKFKDGKIIQHTDEFNMWKWTQQALGLPGYLLGWSSFMKGKIQQQTNKLLNNFIKA